LLVQNKVPKQKDPCRISSAPLCCSPSWQSIETHPSDLRKPQATAELKQAISESSHDGSAAWRGSRRNRAHHDLPFLLYLTSLFNQDW